MLILTECDNHLVLPCAGKRQNALTSTVGCFASLLTMKKKFFGSFLSMTEYNQMPNMRPKLLNNVLKCVFIYS